MTTAAEKRALVGASKCIALADPPPPGERAEDELLGSVALEALHDALLDITGEPRVKFANVRDIDVRKVGRWVLITVKSRGTDVNELTFRINIGWAKVLRGRLSKVLG